MKYFKFYMFTIVVAAILIFSVVTITRKINDGMDDIEKNVTQNIEIQTRIYIENTLKTTRESVMYEINNRNIDVNNYDDVQEIIKKFINPLELSDYIDDIVLIQVTPSQRILYTSNTSIDVSTLLVDDVRKGIDSSIYSGNVFEIRNDKLIIEWIGIPPGTQSFKNNSKWVLMALKKKSYINLVSQSIILFQSAILDKINAMATISSAATIILMISIVLMQREFHQSQ